MKLQLKLFSSPLEIVFRYKKTTKSITVRLFDVEEEAPSWKIL